MIREARVTYFRAAEINRHEETARTVYSDMQLLINSLNLVAVVLYTCSPSLLNGFSPTVPRPT